MKQNSEIFSPKSKDLNLARFFVGVGLVALLVLFFKDSHRAWGNVLINNFYFLSLALAGLLFMAIQYVANAGWWTVLRRIPESMMSFLPIAAGLMFTLFLGMHELYHWSQLYNSMDNSVVYDAVLQKKSAYLNIPFFMLRMGVFLGVWIFFSKLFRKASLEEDQGSQSHSKFLKYSAIFLPIFAVTFSLASVDWIKSLEPHWFSTIFGLYTFSGLFLHGIAFMTLAVVLLKERGYLSFVNENHLHDLGKLVFAFSTFWAYIWFCQYMLIWYSNIPEETVYYVTRTDPEWSWLFVLNLVMNWLVPFLILMPRSSKRKAMVLKRVCLLLLVGHWLDLYLMVMPSISHVTQVRWIGVEEILISLGYGGLFALILMRSLSAAPLTPQKAPFLS
ncbi:MAG: hypothetical protein IPJ69_04015 [Deltaproteobacteria bacterium]|nr:MAG: hypothetical protein IPJ69_04015 [Deltaproteobacteria bacterium]